MNNAVADKPVEWMVGLLGTLSTKPAFWSATAAARPNEVRPVTNDLTSLHIQSLAGRGLVDPKSLRLREIQELSASVVAHIRAQHVR